MEFNTISDYNNYLINNMINLTINEYRENILEILYPDFKLEVLNNLIQLKKDTNMEFDIILLRTIYPMKHAKYSKYFELIDNINFAYSRYQLLYTNKKYNKAKKNSVVPYWC
jgi:hypothetical protein